MNINYRCWIYTNIFFGAGPLIDPSSVSYLIGYICRRNSSSIALNAASSVLVISVSTHVLIQFVQVF